MLVASASMAVTVIPSREAAASKDRRVRVLFSKKKSTAERAVYGAFEIIESKTRNDPLAMFRRALDNVRPRVEVKSRRVGGATYQVPVEVTPNRGTALAMRWMVQFARARAGKSMREKLAAELLDAAAERGEAVRKREETHRMADANRAFAHYRW